MCTIFTPWIFILVLECGVNFSKYFEWKDGIQCQNSILTKISHVRFLKICQNWFLTLDSIFPFKIIGKSYPMFNKIMLAQKSYRKRPTTLSLKKCTKSMRHFHAQIDRTFRQVDRTYRHVNNKILGSKNRKFSESLYWRVGPWCPVFKEWPNIAIIATARFGTFRPQANIQRFL